MKEGQQTESRVERIRRCLDGGGQWAKSYLLILADRVMP